MARYMTASEGWRFRPGDRALVKEPAGTRHAVGGGSDRTLCGWHKVEALTCFPHLGFMTARLADRCPECQRLARHEVRTG